MTAYQALPDDEDIQYASSFTTLANLLKMLIGSGVLSYSWAFQFGTLWPSLACTALMSALAAFNFTLLGWCSETTGQGTFSGIWRHTVGVGHAWVVDLLKFVFVFMTEVSLLIIIGDFLPKGVESLGICLPASSPFCSLFSNRRVMILLTSAAILPLNFLEDLSFLGWTSVIGITGSLYTCGVLVFAAAESGLEAPDWEACALGPGFFILLPTLAYGFCSHFSAPEMYQQLQGRSPKKWFQVTTLAYGFNFLVTAACGITGYVMFGSELALPSRSNVLTAPALQAWPSVMVAYLATVVSVALGVPIYTLTLRDTLDGLWLRDSPSFAQALAGRLKPGVRHAGLSTFVVVSTVGASMMLDNLGYVNALNGVLGLLLMLVFPSLMYLRLGAKLAPDGHGRLLQRLSIFSISVGLSATVVGLGATMLIV